ncbi:hypothetical protein VP01_2369g1, partial [Puccinia sorghi]
THIFKQPFTSVNLDQSCSNGNGLKTLVCNSLSFTKATNSKFTLMLDMWTIKGNHFGFIGASVTFIDYDWNYVVQHLSLNLVAWTHKGSLLEEPIVNLLSNHAPKRNINLYCDIYMLCQTTDSGSNNKTMAIKMHQRSYELEGSEISWDCDTMHIKCFCHKMALVVNAGLKKFGLEAPPPPKLKKAFLGSLPYSYHLMKLLWMKMDQIVKLILIISKTKMLMIPIFVQFKHPEKRNLLPQTETNPIILINSISQLECVAKGITGSSAWQQEFKQCDNTLEDHITRQSCKQNPDWMQIKHLNDELKPFNFLTKEIEGDGPTSAFFLANYYQTMKYLKKKEASGSPANTFYPIFFAHCWPQREKNARLILENNFNKQEAQIKKSQDDRKELKKDTPKVDTNNIFEFFNAPPNSAESRELEVYVKNMDHLETPAAKDQKSLLTWWKDHSKTFLVLLSFAKDYLARLLSKSFPNFCSSCCESLKPRTIERCVSIYMWLKQGIQVTGMFEKGQKNFI